ncbi:MAG: hypothetical protein WB117_00540, partial [Candidatus Acidiferrales bacterium]
MAGPTAETGNRCIATGLVMVNDRDGVIHTMRGAINVTKHTDLEAAGCGIVFFPTDIVMSLDEEIVGFVQAACPGGMDVHRGVIVNVFAIVNRGVLDFVDCFVNLVDRVIFFGAQRAAVRALQVRTGIPQIGKGMEIGRVFTLGLQGLVGERRQKDNRQG